MPTPDINLVLAGGLGQSELGYIRARAESIPRIRVAWAGDWDAWKDDLGKLTLANKLRYNCIIGHSFAGISLLTAIGYYPDLFDFAAFIDPVSYKTGVSSYPAPLKMCPFQWYQRKDHLLGIIGYANPLHIENAGSPEIINDSHNGMPKNPYVVEKIISAILELPPSPAPSFATASVPMAQAGEAA